jgi:hypothetical protein
VAHDSATQESDFGHDDGAAVTRTGTGHAADTVIVPRYRRVGLRMSCWTCEVAWTGAVESTCWVCDGPGVPGPPPSIYPDLD